MLSTKDEPVWDDAWVLARRPGKNAVDPHEPYALLVEPEYTRHALVEDVAAVFLTNRECPFRCVMCDLWKNTTDIRVPAGAIATQVEGALKRIPGVRHIKLYNAGNFFDAQAVPPGDLPRIAALLAPLSSVVVECHPLLVGGRCLEFRDRLRPELQVAMGLETVHPEVLPRTRTKGSSGRSAPSTSPLTSAWSAVSSSRRERATVPSTNFSSEDCSTRRGCARWSRCWPTAWV
jgi:uncharacterized Fe-S cluster-containing MiaB family protein